MNAAPTDPEAAPDGRIVAARRHVAPYFVAMLGAFATVPLPPDTSDASIWGIPLLMVAGALTLVGALWALVVHARAASGDRAVTEHGWAPALPAYLLFAAIACMRHAEGQSASGFGVLVLLPLVYLALHTGRLQLWTGILLMGAMFAIPILAIGAPEYPTIEWRRTLLWLLVGSIAAFTIQRLVTGVRTDASDAEAASRTDALTGLPNRRAMSGALEQALARAQRTADPVAVAMVDMDHFKRFNDTHGHAAGDQLLREAAAAWQSQLRAGDMIARYGGEEFTVILPSCTPPDARRVAERLLAATPSGQTCSIGLAAWQVGEQPSALLSRADAALYAAKHAGRARVVEAQIEASS